MRKAYLTFLTSLIGNCAIITTVFAQLPADPSLAVLNKYQDSLVQSSAQVYNAASNTERFNQNAKLIKQLVNALKTPGSYAYGFDSLKTISVIKSPDNTFRIFSWSVPTDQGTYRFFGTVQMATKDGKLKLYPLIDGTEQFKDDNEITTSKQWYGARYDEIVPVMASGQQTCYVLLGWKGNTRKTSKKVIEVLSFKDDVLQFGKPLFENSKNAPLKNRVVFEYNKLNSMTLRLDKKEQMIVFDHLAPFDPKMEGNFEYYASDSSFDGYRLAGDKLKLTENVEPVNDPDQKDDLYIDPKLKTTPVTKKF